jgi:hypothetical protein
MAQRLLFVFGAMGDVKLDISQAHPAGNTWKEALHRGPVEALYHLVQKARSSPARPPARW